MAVSSSISGYEKTINVNNNTSYVHVDFTITTGSKTYNNEGSAYYHINCNGQSTGNINFTIGKGKTKTFSADFGPFTHNADGSMGAVNIEGYANLNVSGGTTTSKSNVSMSTIPRASDFSFSGTTLGSNTRVNISRASSSFTHRVKYVMGDITQNYTDIGTVCDFTRPYTDAQQFASNSASGTGSITVITYSGGTEIGRKSKNIVMTLPDNNDTKPVMNSETVIEDLMSAISEKFNKFIRLNSVPKFTFDYSARYGANIKEYSVVIDNNNYNSASSELITGVLNNSGSIQYTCSIKDTRGRITTETGVITVADYNEPELNIKVERTEQNSCNVYITGNITPIDNENDKLLYIKYKTHNSQAYQSVNVPLDEEEYEINKTIAIPISDSSSYDFYGTISDFFNTYDTSIEHISTAFDLFHFRNTGLGIGIGKKAEFDALDIGMDIYYKGEMLDNYVRGLFDDYDEEEF